MSAPVAARLAAILEPGDVTSWTRERDGASFPLAAPRTLEQFVEVMRLAAADGLTLQPIGLGSKLAWCRPAKKLDFVLTTRHYTGVIEYEAQDGTLTARAGTTMAALADLVAAGGHHLAPDVARPTGSTLGGVLAAAQNGVDRLRYGAARDQVLGATVLLADGRLSKSGGRLVKNVTGYDLARGWCGSHGTLCVILEASLRLYPRPAARGVGMVRMENRGEALDLAARLRALPVEFVTLTAHDLDDSQPDRPWTLLFVLAGGEDLVAWEVELLERVAPGIKVARGESAEEIAPSVRDLELSTDRWPTFSFACRPSNLEANLIALAQIAGECGLAPRLLTHPALARTVVWLDADDPAEDPPRVERLVAFHGRMLELPLRVQWLDPPAALVATIDPFGAPTAGLPLMRKLKHALDPDERLATGRFHAGL